MSVHRSAKAAALYDHPLNCAQTILAVSVDDANAEDSPLLVDSAAGLGGGLASQGLTCGAMIGGLMALSLELTRRGIKDKARSTALKTFATEFKLRNGHINCAELTGMNFNTETNERCRARVVEVVEYIEAEMACVDEAKLER